MGGKDINLLDFSEGSPENCIVLDTGVLSDYGCLFWLAFDGNEERLIYSTDYEKTFQEKRYPKGTIEKLISSLPSAESLSIKRLKNFVSNTEIMY
ncbi:hypothetical protein GCM10023211_09230 [Orbus sasakiae]|uniref:Uncharacterized protein n=1 Tax=Orbus sasakiae TaxID=1078475 RepID=A0ABP9N2J3_9GAMM